MIYVSRYEKVFHDLYRSSKSRHLELRALATALRGRIDDDSITRRQILSPLSVALFPFWRACYSYMFFEKNSVISRRVRYRLVSESINIDGIDRDDIISTAFISMIDTIERYLDGTNAQSLQVFIVNNLPSLFCQNMKAIASRYEGKYTREYLVMHTPDEDPHHLSHIDKSYMERYLLGMSKTKFYRILNIRDSRGLDEPSETLSP